MTKANKKNLQEFASNWIFVITFVVKKEKR